MKAWRTASIVLGSWAAAGLLCLLAARVHGVPVLLPPGWAAAAVLVLPLVLRAGWAMRLGSFVAVAAGVVVSADAVAHPAVPVPLLLVYAALLVLQAALVARSAVRILGSLPGDRRPLHLARVGTLARFVFVDTLFSCAAVAAATGLLWWGAGQASDEEALQIALLHGAAATLAHVAITPALWWQRLRQQLGLTAAVLVACAALPALAGDAPALFWLAPALLFVAGATGGVCLVGAAVVVLGASLLLQLQWHEIPPFEGPSGFVVWLLTMWRLTMSGFVVGLFADRRRVRPAGVPDRAACHRGLASLAGRLQRDRDPQRRMGLVYGHWSPLPATVDPLAPVAAADSLQAVAALQRMAHALRPGDHIACFGRHDLVLLLLDPPEGNPAALRAIHARLAAAAGVPVHWQPLTVRPLAEVRQLIESTGRHWPDSVVASTG